MILNLGLKYSNQILSIPPQRSLSLSLSLSLQGPSSSPQQPGAKIERACVFKIFGEGKGRS